MAITKKDIAEYVASVRGMSKRNAEEIVEDVFARIASELEAGDEVSINNFGKFVVKTRAARQGRNPSTGETVQIPEKNAVQFKPAKALKDMV